MRIEDFGFEPVVGKEYVVSFTKEGELLSTSIYNGSPLPAVSFPDNAKIGLSITDKETGKQVMSTDFISYNGKLYKAVFNLPLKEEGTNKNANIYIKDLHYDLTTGSVLVQVQGFKGDNYKLNIADSTLKHKVMSLPIVLEDNMYYSVPTELVQGNKFEVVLQDQHGKSIDAQEFTAPISTDWRYTDTVENGNLELDPEAEQPQVDVPGQGQQQQQPPTLESTQQDSILPDVLAPYEKQIIIGGGVVLLLLVLVLIVKMIKKRKASKTWTEYDDDENLEYDEESEDNNDDEFEEVGMDDEDHRDRNQIEDEENFDEERGSQRDDRRE